MSFAAVQWLHTGSSLGRERWEPGKDPDFPGRGIQKQLLGGGNTIAQPVLLAPVTHGYWVVPLVTVERGPGLSSTL